MSKGKKHAPPKCPVCKRRRPMTMHATGQSCQDCARKRARKAA